MKKQLKVVCHFFSLCTNIFNTVVKNNKIEKILKRCIRNRLKAKFTYKLSLFPNPTA